MLQNSLIVKENYNASMIHELRNPLSAIIGSIGLLKDSKELSREDAETLNIASVSSDFLIALINNALDGAKLEANKLELDPRMNDIIQILTKSVCLYHWKSQEKKVKIQLLIGKTIPEQVEIDDARLTQILVNIIGNAVKFTDENGSVKVKARFVHIEGNHELLASEFNKSHFSKLKPEQDFQDDQDDEEYEKMNYFEQQIGIDAQINDKSKFIQENKRIDFDVNDASVIQFEDELNMDDKSISQKSYNNILKKDYSQTSLCNVSSIDEEHQMNDKIYHMEKDLTIKNSIAEWLAFGSDPMKDFMLNNIELKSNLTNLNEYQRIPTNQFIKHQVSDKSLAQSEAQKQYSSYSKSSATRKVYQGRKDSSYGFSDSLPRDNSISMDSFQFAGDVNFSKTYTNSTNSNQAVVKKKQIIKSKFFKQENLQGSEEESSKELKKSRYLYISEQGNEKILIQNQLDITKDQKMEKVRGTLIIEIIDSGIGMTQEGISKLFKPFSQADKSIYLKYGGTGLGLWITSKLIGLMKGSINVHSEINKGTTFTLSIPVIAEYNSLFQSDCKQSLRLMMDTPPQQLKSLNNNKLNTSEDICQSNSIKVLLLQKDAMMRNLFKKYMTKSKIRSKFTSNYKEFMKAFKAKNYSACFIDLDTGLKLDELEQIMQYREQKNEKRAKGPYKESNIKIYCFHSNEIENAKMKVLRKHDIVYFKKPVQDYKLSNFLNKLKENSDKEQLYSNLPRISSQDQEIYKIACDQQRLKAPSMNAIPLQNRQRRNTVIEVNKQSFSEALMEVQQLQKQDTNCLNSYRTEQRNDSKLFIGEDEETRKHSNINSNKNIKIISPELILQKVQNRKQQNKNTIQEQNFDNDGDDEIQISPLNYVSKLKFSKGANRKETLKLSQFDNLGMASLISPQIATDSFQEALTNRNKTDNNLQLRSLSMKQNSKRDMKLRKSSSLLEDEEEKSSRKSQHTANFCSTNGNQYQSKFNKVNSMSFGQNTFGNERSQSDEKFKNSVKSANFGNPSSIDESDSAPKIKIINTQYAQSTNITNTENLIILIVDDDKMNQHVLSKLMEKLPTVKKNKVEILIADNGLEGFNMYKAQESFKNGIIMNRVKLIMMDCEMAVLDGYEATKKIRDFESSNYLNTNKTCIIGVSGNGGEQHSRKCKAAGMNSTILKPITADQLKQIVNNAILPFTKSQFSR